MTVGERIVKYRKARGLTQWDLAKQAKVSQPFLSEIENGKRHGGDNLGLSTAKRIAKVLNVSIDMLAGYKPKESSNGHTRPNSSNNLPTQEESRYVQWTKKPRKTGQGSTNDRERDKYSSEAS